MWLISYQYRNVTRYPEGVRTGSEADDIALIKMHPVSFIAANRKRVDALSVGDFVPGGSKNEATEITRIYSAVVYEEIEVTQEEIDSFDVYSAVDFLP